MIPQRFNGHSVQDETYRSWFETADPTFERSIAPVTHRVPRQAPVFVGADPAERQVILHIALKSGGIDTGLEQLEEWFPPGLQGELIALDGATEKALDCVVLRARRYTPTVTEFTVQLIAHEAAWRSADAVTTSEAVTSDGQSWTSTNSGNADDDGAVLRFTPTAQKDAANGQLYRRRVAIVPQIDRDFHNWAFDLTDGGLDTTGSKFQDDGDDIRLLLNGVEDLPYWFGEHTDNDPNSAATKIWTNLTVPARRATDLLEAMTATVPADGDEIPAPLRGVRQFPRSGAIRIGTEIITYGSWTPSNDDGVAAFQDITRGAWGSTAATHSAGDDVEWVPFFVDVLYGWTGAEAHEARPDLKPMLDLTSNTLTNSRLEWLDFLDDTEGYARSMQWRRRFRERNSQSDRIVGARGTPLAALTFEYQKDGPVTDKPGTNEYWHPFPSGTDDDGSGNVASITRVVADTLAMIVRCVDGEGQESKLATYSGALTSASANITQPTNPAYEIAFEGRSQVVFSAMEGANAGETNFVSANEAHQEWTPQSEGVWTKTRARITHGSGAGTTTLNVYPDASGPDETAAVATATHDESHGAGIAELLEFDHADVYVFEGTSYWCRLQSSGGNVARWHYRRGIHPRGGAENASGFIPVTHDIQIISTEIDPDPAARADDGDQATVAAMTVWLLPAGVPDFQWLPEEDIYHFNGEYLENETTQQRVTLRNVVCKVGETIAIDTAKRTALNETTGENVIAGVEFSDPEHPFTRVSGSNSLVFSGAGVTGMTVAVTGYSRWV